MSLEAALRANQLGQYLDNFTEVGITSPDDLVHLTLEDYHTLGVDDVADRKRLFQLVQAIIKRSKEPAPSAAAAKPRASKQPNQQAASGAGGGGGGGGGLGQARKGSGAPKRSGGSSASLGGGSDAGSFGKGASGLRAPKSSGLPRPAGGAGGGALPSALPTPAAPASALPRMGARSGSLKSPSPSPSRPSPSPSRSSRPSPSSSPSPSPSPPPSGVDAFLALSKDLFKIRVAVRKRPLNSKETKKKETDAMDMPDHHTLFVEEQKQKVDLTKYTEKHTFNFDECIAENASTLEVYERTVRPLLSATFNQAKTTCFAYGQTGSGKTYTMGPLPMLAATDVITTLRHRQFAHLKVWVSVFEIYLSSVFDLLNERKRLVIREDSSKTVHIVGLQEVEMEGADHLAQLLTIAEKARSSAPTHANAKSSRSHQVLQLSLKEGDQVYGKMSFIDLAGSEWGADIKDTNRQTRMEGAEINKSLLALKECIRALDRDQGHVPFRGSKLTEVLKDSFTGNSFTMMIACVSPASGSVEHSLNTLRYADRVKELQQPRDKSKPYVDKLTPGSLPNQRPAASPSPAPASEPDVPPPDERHHRQRSDSFVIRNEDERDLVAETAQDEVLKQHDELIDMILEEEEQLLIEHRSEIEETMHMVKEEMKLLDMMDNPGTQVDDYVQQLKVVLDNKMAVISRLRANLDIFHRHLQQEDQMSKAFMQHSYSRFY